MVAVWVAACALFVNASAQQAQLVSAVIDGCGTDGTSESMVIYTGGTDMTDVLAADIDIRFENSNPATTTITESFTSNASHISDMNDLLPGSCDFSFTGVDLGITDIPAGSHILILNDDVSTVVDYDNWCGSGLGNSSNLIYVMFSSDATWGSSGTFTNDPGIGDANRRYFRSNITNDGGTTVTDLNYNSQWASIADGNYVQWNDGGGAAAVYSNYTNCTPDNVNGLPVSMLSFSANQNNNQLEVVWSTASESGNSHFDLYRSADGLNWEWMATLPGARDTNETQVYRYTDQAPLRGRNFYRLRQTDFNGNTETLEALSVFFDTAGMTLNLYPNPSSDYISVKCHEEVLYLSLISSDGVVHSLYPENSGNLTQEFDIRQLPSGIYQALIHTGQSTFRKRLIKK